MTDIRLLLKAKSTPRQCNGAGRQTGQLTYTLAKNGKAMEEIFVDTAIEVSDVKNCLNVLFARLLPFQWFPWEGDVNPIGFERDNPEHVLFDIYREDKRLEFKWRLSLHSYLEEYEKRERVIANYLSIKMQTRALVSYQLPERPTDPFYNLIYDKGFCYLADDCMFDWTGEADEPSEPIKIIRSMELPDANFDAMGKVLK